jgi:hypothetical protein
VFTITGTGGLQAIANGKILVLKNVIIDAPGITGDIVIPEGVTALCDDVFQGSGITSISLPSTLSELGSNTFAYCGSLKTVSIHEDAPLKQIKYRSPTGMGVFFSTGIENISLPKALESIDTFAFALCSSLASITIPENVTFIDRQAFEEDTALAEITMLPTEPPNLGSTGFLDFNMACVIKVPAASVDAYKAAWSDHAECIEAIIEG